MECLNDPELLENTYHIFMISPFIIYTMLLTYKLTIDKWLLAIVAVHCLYCTRCDDFKF